MNRILPRTSTNKLFVSQEALKWRSDSLCNTVYLFDFDTLTCVR